MQPMMVVNASPDQFPVSLGVLLARWAWLYRSELAPVGVATAVMGAGCWAHSRFPHDWGFVLVGFSAAAWLVVTFGARLGLSPLAERAYAGIATLAAGSWLTVATARGPFTSPLPQAFAVGAVILSVPWWAHRRRRAKVRENAKSLLGRISPGR
jgi:hypothetical protein